MTSRRDPESGSRSARSGTPRAGAHDGPAVTTRALGAADADAFQALRLQGLQEAPAAFASSFDEEAGTDLAEVARRLEPTDGSVVLGAFSQSVLVGIVGVQREAQRKLAHKAWVWGLYVAPKARRRGVARRLLEQALAYAGTVIGVERVNLGVNTENAAALSLYEGLGFTVFGLERGFLRLGDVLHDEYHMAREVGREA